MEDRSVFDLTSDAPAHRVAYGAHPDQVMDVVGTGLESSHPIALLHGGYWRPQFDRTYLRPLASTLGASVTTYNVEYRRVPGDPEGQWEDVQSALAHIAAHEGPPIVIGHSAGGHLALLAAIHRPEFVRACLAVAPVTDLVAAEESDADDGAVRDFLGGPAREFAHLDPARLPRPTVDYLVVHGTRDIRVPVEMSHDYGDTITQDVGHFEWVDPRTPACALIIDQALRWAEPRHQPTR